MENTQHLLNKKKELLNASFCLEDEIRQHSNTLEQIGKAASHNNKIVATQKRIASYEASIKQNKEYFNQLDAYLNGERNTNEKQHWINQKAEVAKNIENYERELEAAKASIQGLVTIEINPDVVKQKIVSLQEDLFKVNRDLKSLELDIQQSLLDTVKSLVPN